MRRKPGTLVPLEEAICVAAKGLRARGSDTFHGFLIAKELETLTKASQLTAHGTLYRALGRLEAMGLLSSDWEDPQLAADEGRPRRRLYKITDKGLRAAAAVEAGSGSKSNSQTLVRA